MAGQDPTCPICVGPYRRNVSRVSGGDFDAAGYAYLLGLYLGDGWLSRHRRSVYKLRISLDARQPAIARECAAAVATVSRGRSVSLRPEKGCVVLGGYWKHWPCLFPQHGVGRKHRRRIRLRRWQSAIAREHPERLLRGLIQADGCRVENRVNGRAYPRYFFSNRSADILAIFCRACDDLGLAWTRPSAKHVSIARRPGVARLDDLVGPKS